MIGVRELYEGLDHGDGESDIESRQDGSCTLLGVYEPSRALDRLGPYPEPNPIPRLLPVVVMKLRRKP